MKLSEMNGTQRIAYKNARNIFDWEVGGWYNCIQDGCEEYIPDTIEEAKEIIYDETMNCSSRGGGHFSTRPIEEVRFAGSAFVKEVIDKLFKKDGDIVEIAEAKGWVL